MKESHKPIRRVGIVANSGKASARGVVREAARLIRKSGRTVSCDAATAELAGFPTTDCPSVATLPRRVDVLLVFGGDGTMLRVAREIAGSRTPVLGINVGGLGFLTGVSSSDLARALANLWRGEFALDERALIEASGQLGDRLIHAVALNDFVVSRGIVSRLIELEVTVNGETLTNYRCDGLIVSSPTGSTAYSLSAGGAVVSPAAEVLTITPVCPHTLSNRSVIVRLDARIAVRVLSERLETILSADGTHEAQLNAGDLITIGRSRHSVRLVHLPGTSFFETLRRKLHWRGSTLSEK